MHTLAYERVYLPLHKVADTPFHIQGDELLPNENVFIDVHIAILYSASQLKKSEQRNTLMK